ncbi:hypothetical protein [Natrinema halophilum]|uniref:VOC domain-containing protein n=1 Tax=Natrinema halophilum TaxID=1699371 RepID=A0A7D5GJE8_9EURY|nr:hypothetical protein [Natrinema halophilum]QLG50554.1 hypothetical protein HYG82_17735 [Natrinema halophilum]
MVWFELLVPDELAVDAVRNRLADAGVSISEIGTERGFEVADPDGNRIRIRIRIRIRSDA